jgi:hypothetical protein
MDTMALSIRSRPLTLGSREPCSPFWRDTVEEPIKNCWRLRQDPFTDVSQQAFNQVGQIIRPWLENCSKTHMERCGHRQISQSFPESIPIILIDVKNLCLIRSITSQGYFALSYVWGSIYQDVTKTENLEERMVFGALERLNHPLPNVIKDAIALTIALGLRYLWVDALVCEILVAAEPSS